MQKVSAKLASFQILHKKQTDHRKRNRTNEGQSWRIPNKVGNSFNSI